MRSFRDGTISFCRRLTVSSMRGERMRVRVALGMLFVVLAALTHVEATARTEDDLRVLEDELWSLWDQGKYKEAIPLGKAYVSASEKRWGKEHPEFAASLGILARLYGAIGDRASAESLYLRELEIEERTLGPQDPGTATTLNKLGMLR